MCDVLNFPVFNTYISQEGSDLRDSGKNWRLLESEMHRMYNKSTGFGKYKPSNIYVMLIIMNVSVDQTRRISCASCRDPGGQAFLNGGPRLLQPAFK